MQPTAAPLFFSEDTTITKLLSIRVNGTPKATPRTRSSHQHGKTHHWTPPTANAWKADIAAALEAHIPATPHEGPMELRVTTYIDRPQSHYGDQGQIKDSAPSYPHTDPKDWDNLGKLASDMLKPGFWRDDRQVVNGLSFKRWADDRLAGALIEVFAL